jgi:hypothetical protein
VFSTWLHEAIHLSFQVLEPLPVTANHTVKAHQGGAVAEELEQYRLETAPDFLLGFSTFHTLILNPNFGMSR